MLHLLHNLWNKYDIGFTIFLIGLVFCLIWLLGCIEAPDKIPNITVLDKVKELEYTVMDKLERVEASVELQLAAVATHIQKRDTITHGDKWSERLAILIPIISTVVIIFTIVYFRYKSEKIRYLKSVNQ